MVGPPERRGGLLDVLAWISGSNGSRDVSDLGLILDIEVCRVGVVKLVV